MVGQKDIQDWLAKFPRKVRKELSFTVRDELAMIQTAHMTKTTRRSGSSRSRAVRGKWTHRSGDLAKSFHIDWKPGQHYGAYGSALPRAKKIEEGGVIKPRGKYLAIPTEHAPKKVWPRHVPGLVFIMSRKGNPLLVKPNGSNSFEIMYILKRSVRLAPRRSLDKAVKTTEKQRAKRVDKMTTRIIEGGGNGSTQQN